MPPRPERAALRERYDRRQAQVVVDAARVFAERGYDQTSVPELAEALGVAAGSLYHYFGGKEQLLIAICDQLMHPLLARAHELLATDEPPEAQLRAVVRLWVEHVIAHRDHMLVFQQERHVIDHGEQWRKVRDDRKRFERMVAVVLEQAHERGATRLEDPRLSLAALLGMVNHTAQWHRPRGRLTACEIADGYVALVLAPAGSGRRATG
jgi:TetR/AcrR family transcriptional regulator, cholesterol catabolism regulator